MKIKWYISTIVLVLTFFGICSNQLSSPNQEILLKFDTEEVTIEQSLSAIEAIKQQLSHFGIESFHIHENVNGEIRISYHSSIAVESIKKTLFNGQLGIDFTSLDNSQQKNEVPSQKHDFDLDVYELQKNADHSTGEHAWVVKQDYDRFLNPNFFPSSNHSEFKTSNEIENSTNEIFRDVTITITNTSYIIPEVRAGPKTSLAS
ncbi:MAG TPA: hypothetical protein VKZ98_04310 [Aquaticitalea sp.]|nr:hypothetical protein [Aquaticitalea sp.]